MVPTGLWLVQENKKLSLVPAGLCLSQLGPGWTQLGSSWSQLGSGWSQLVSSMSQLGSGQSYLESGWSQAVFCLVIRWALAGSICSLAGASWPMVGPSWTLAGPSWVFAVPRRLWLILGWALAGPRQGSGWVPPGLWLDPAILWLVLAGLWPSAFSACLFLWKQKRQFRSPRLCLEIPYLFPPSPLLSFVSPLAPKL
jgi:hypothetical protein